MKFSENKFMSCTQSGITPWTSTGWGTTGWTAALREGPGGPGRQHIERSAEGQQRPESLGPGQ